MDQHTTAEAPAVTPLWVPEKPSVLELVETCRY
jgi:hypothetical protein